MKLNIDITHQTIPMVKEALTKCAILREVLIVNEFQRGIGKTTAVVEFAKEHGLVAIVKHDAVAKLLRSKFDYQKIICERDVQFRGSKEPLVYDEGVDATAFANTHRIVTGIMRV